MKIKEMFPYLHVRNAAQAIDFYNRAFGAQEKFRLTEPSGRIGHAELDFGGMTLMLSDEYPECGIRGPQAAGETTVTMHLHVDNADEFIQRAAKARGRGREAAAGRVLRRAWRGRAGPVRPSVEHRAQHRGSLTERDAAALR